MHDSFAKECKTRDSVSIRTLTIVGRKLRRYLRMASGEKTESCQPVIL